MNKIIKKIFRSILYVVGVVAFSMVPDMWLWHIGVSEWPLPLAILWWVPTLLILLAEMGLQLGKFHRESVRVLFTLILFSVMPKVVFILFDFIMPWFFAILPALALMGWFLFGFVATWKTWSWRRAVSACNWWCPIRTPPAPPSVWVRR
jgi:hypothetical protein